MYVSLEYICIQKNIPVISLLICEPSLSLCTSPAHIFMQELHIIEVIVTLLFKLNHVINVNQKKTCD